MSHVHLLEVSHHLKFVIVNIVSTYALISLLHVLRKWRVVAHVSDLSVVLHVPPVLHVDSLRCLLHLLNIGLLLLVRHFVSLKVLHHIDSRLVEVLLQISQTGEGWQTLIEIIRCLLSHLVALVLERGRRVFNTLFLVGASLPLLFDQLRLIVDGLRFHSKT